VLCALIEPWLLRYPVRTFMHERRLLPGRPLQV